MVPNIGIRQIKIIRQIAGWISGVVRVVQGIQKINQQQAKLKGKWISGNEGLGRRWVGG